MGFIKFRTNSISGVGPDGKLPKLDKEVELYGEKIGDSFLVWNLTEHRVFMM